MTVFVARITAVLVLCVIAGAIASHFMAASAWIQSGMDVLAFCAVAVSSFAVIRAYRNTIARLRHSPASGKQVFGDIVAAANPGDALEIAVASRDAEIRRLCEGFANRMNGLKSEMEYCRGEFLELIKPVQLTFYNRENGVTIAEKMLHILDDLNGSIRNTVKDMEQQSQTLTLTFEAFDITTLTMGKVDGIIRQATSMAQDLVIRTGEGRNAIVNTKKSMEEIMKYSEQMAGIVTTIVDIADSTNVLAINAAIESTRAGKAGSGFGVIATEIRKLSDRTKKGSIEINTIIHEIARKIAVQVELNGLVFDTFSNITEFIKKTNSLNEEIYKISKKNIIQGKEIQTAVNTLKSIAERIIKSSNKEFFEINEVVNIMRMIESIFSENMPLDRMESLRRKIDSLYALEEAGIYAEKENSRG